MCIHTHTHTCINTIFMLSIYICICMYGNSDREKQAYRHTHARTNIHCTNMRETLMPQPWLYSRIIFTTFHIRAYICVHTCVCWCRHAYTKFMPLDCIHTCMTQQMRIYDTIFPHQPFKYMCLLFFVSLCTIDCNLHREDKHDGFWKQLDCCSVPFFRATQTSKGGDWRKRKQRKNGHGVQCNLRSIYMPSSSISHFPSVRLHIHDISYLLELFSCHSSREVFCLILPPSSFPPHGIMLHTTRI